MVEIEERFEMKRGCGYRKGGGLYLVSGREGIRCSKLPIRLTVCPTCHGGIKPSRGWTWVEADPICEPGPHGTQGHDLVCPLARPMGRCGLLWIGGSYYASPDAFLRESAAQGVSRRISALPKGLEIGKTLVLLAHREGTRELCEECGGKGHVQNGNALPVTCEECEGEGLVGVPAIFQTFVPTAVEYVVKGDEDEEALERLVARGITVVDVKPAEEVTDAH